MVALRHYAEQRFTCAQCGRCCRRGWDIAVTAAEVEGYRKAGAGVGAIVGGIIGGVKGALAGILIGAGGTIAATEGKDVELAQGTTLRVRLDSPLSLAR